MLRFRLLAFDPPGPRVALTLPHMSLPHCPYPTLTLFDPRSAPFTRPRSDRPLCSQIARLALTARIIVYRSAIMYDTKGSYFGRD